MLVHLDDQNVEVYEAIKIALLTGFKFIKVEDEEAVYKLVCNAGEKNYNKWRTGNLKEGFI